MTAVTNYTYLENFLGMLHLGCFNILLVLPEELTCDARASAFQSTSTLWAESGG